MCVVVGPHPEIVCSVKGNGMLSSTLIPLIVFGVAGEIKPVKTEPAAPAAVRVSVETEHGGPGSEVTTQEKLTVRTERPFPSPAGSVYIAFAHDPHRGHYDGVIGLPDDVWNFVEIGTTAIDYMRHPDASSSTARLRISRHDGEWGIDGHSGIFRGYIYHNCQCVDLEVTVLDLAPARYKAYVYAHGDAPNQNAKIEIVVGDRSIGQKATANDGTWGFRSKEFKEGVQYVSFEFDVPAGKSIRFISHRDGSDYSMFNAIQLVPVVKAQSDDDGERDDDLPQDRQTRGQIDGSVQAVESSEAGL